MAIISIPLALGVWWHSHRFVYYRNFGQYRFAISPGAEIHHDGTKHRTLDTSFIERRPVFMYGVRAFRIPDDRPVQFNTIYDESNCLFCIFDTNNWGYIAIVNTATNEFFSSDSPPGIASDSKDWSDEYKVLKLTHPDLPYAGIFDCAPN